ncbi:DMT family transporter [Aciditerrimonas ferrireducens]|jgi:drug/metabolite transporter (DMT)-like permease|uniref:DMT family transporter n=1 Tax=Aciditerrimonas ferrireducens TaxID=667306 RepID=A0ABV6C5J5_9ACTN|nr:DMT family transporter [Aciditerrimonas ferrireducens]MCK4177876.1 DMT family transporter [Aciditerrimonas ferrireducens]
MAYLFAVGAALANALTTILQRLGVREAPPEASLRLALLTHAIRRPVWLAGTGTLLLGFLLQAAALHEGPLSEVQPVLTLELPFLVAILGLWFGVQVGLREWGGAILGAGGLAVFLAAADPQRGPRVPDLRVWGLVAFSVVAASALALGLAQIGSAQWRAAMYGASAAIMFAFSASLIRQLMLDLSQGFWTLFLRWELWAMAGSGLAAVFLAQNAFHAGPVTASQPTLVIVDPLASIGIGIGLFGDQLQTAGGRGVVESVALLVMCIGGLVLARSPVVADLKAPEGQGQVALVRRRRGGRRASLGKGASPDVPCC